MGEGALGHGTGISENARMHSSAALARLGSAWMAGSLGDGLGRHLQVGVRLLVDRAVGRILRLELGDALAN